MLKAQFQPKAQRLSKANWQTKTSRARKSFRLFIAKPLPGQAFAGKRLAKHLRLNALTVTLFSLLIGGCAQTPVDNTTAPSSQKTDPAVVTPDGLKAEAKAKKAEIAELPSRPFTEQTLYNLLIAELATQERNLPLAIEKYLFEAQSTRDPGVAAQATRLALFGRKASESLTAAELWYEVEPDNEKAAAIYADLLAQSSKPLEAIEVMESQLTLNRQSNFGVLAQTSYPVDKKLLTEVLNRLQPLIQQYPNNVDLLFTHAVLLQENDQHQEALTALDGLKGSKSNPTQTALLKAQLIEKLEGAEPAAKSLKRAINKHPDDRPLQLYMARLLTRFDLKAAEVTFADLLIATPDDPDLLFSHAVVAYENLSFTAAKGSFEKLISRNLRVTVSHYYIGQINAQEEKYDEAIARFKQIQSGKYFMSATQKLIDIEAKRGRIDEAREHLAVLRDTRPLQAPNFWALEADLLKRNGRADDASDLLDEAIERFPEQLLLRLERAIISEQFNDIEMAELDLRFVLDRDPDNVTALNALGYTLANKTTRYNEALDLIERAFALRPDDAAIIDSLGWAQYRLGKMAEATSNLEKAFAEFPDDEVAAHLIEVYWVNGEKNKARAIIKKVKADTEDTPMIDETISRLSIPQ